MGRPEQQQEQPICTLQLGTCKGAGSSAVAGITMVRVPLQLPNCKSTYMLISLLLWSALIILIRLSYIQIYAQKVCDHTLALKCFTAHLFTRCVCQRLKPAAIRHISMVLHRCSDTIRNRPTVL